MNSFDNYIDYQKQMAHIDELPIKYKKSLDNFPDRFNTSNFLSNSYTNNESSFLLPNSTTNKKKRPKFLYSGNQTEIVDISKKNLEYDIQITALKKKLITIKEQRKQSEMKLNLMRLRLNKLQNEEKASIRDLLNIKQSIQKIKTNREKNEKQKTFNKQNRKTHNMIKNKTLSFINNNTNGSFINKSNIIDSDNKNKSYNYLDIKNRLNNIKKINNNIYNNFTPKTKHFSFKQGLTNSINKSNISNDNYIINSVKNASLEKFNINLNSSKNNITNKNAIFSKSIPYKKITKLRINNKNNKNNFKNQIKKNLEKKLKIDEEERNRIQEEINQIEKEQYNLWMNFSQNMNNGNIISKSNINNNDNNNLKNILINKNNDNDEEDDIIDKNNYI